MRLRVSSTNGIVTPTRPERPNRKEGVRKGQEVFSRVLQRPQLKDLPKAGHEKDQAENEPGEEHSPATAAAQGSFCCLYARRRLGRHSHAQDFIELRLVLVPLVMRIVDRKTPDQPAAVTPIIENDAARKRLPFCRDEDDVVLARGSLERFRPVKLERFPLLLGQS